MTTLAPLLQAFFIERLQSQRQASPHTVRAYKLTFSLLLRFARERIGKPPSRLCLEELDVSLVTSFLRHLEVDRNNSVRTRNARLAAIHSFFHYIAPLAPEHADLIRRVLSIPQKRFERRFIDFLSRQELEALLAAPDRETRLGRRDHALLLLASQTGLRASELISLRIEQIVPGKHAHIRCLGKGRKERGVPLTRQTIHCIQAWLIERGGIPEDPVFLSARRGALSLDALEKIVTRHAATAAQTCPSLREKRVTPHVLRHTAAMQLRHAGVDLSVVALWLGHESIETTQIYLHADLASREAALARLAPVETGYRRFKAGDALLDFLDGAGLSRIHSYSTYSHQPALARVGIIRESG
ncbi:MAG: tyrosine-type recombinase/integrase [Desulfuromonadales bacterium]|nr:tyrosine-type recombinase/integrase [Desulfuromonadales bacterium]